MANTVLTTTKWNLDKAHSEIEFKAKHLLITTVTGRFKDYEATVETEGEDFTKTKIEFTADTASIETGNEQRDGHLKGDDFFASQKYPKLTFISTSVEKKDDEHYIVKGDLTIRGVTKPIVLNVEYGGIAKDPWGGTRAGFTVRGKINRKDFGLNWNVLTEGGGMLVSEEVQMVANVQLVKEEKTPNN
jgi:polyisoprenoid-binding protein YceI